MCGFAGIVNLDEGVGKRDLALVRAMAQAQAHRGPDASGTYEDPHAVLGHRRLAIIDIAHSVQPARLGKKVMVFNGEIYNFREIRRELEALGCAFSQQGDTEVLLQAWSQWGVECLQRLNGDFAFAIWDGEQRELVLVRDRLGVKPLYYTRVGAALLFSSEIKGLLAHPQTSRCLDIHGLIEGLTYSQPLPPKTLVHDIFALEPGHGIRMSDRGIEKFKYWDLEYRACQDDFDTAAAKLADLLADAVRLRMVGDVPLSGLLSGGLDSSVLCTLMSELGPRPTVFSIDYAGHRHDAAVAGTHIHESDLSYARTVAARIGADHICEEIAYAEFPDLMAQACRARDMPVVLGSEAAMHRLFESVARRATVALSGDGADEVFLGYYMVVNEAAIDGGISPFFVAPTDRFFQIFRPEVLSRFKPKRYITRRFQEIVAAAPDTGDDAARNLHLMHYLQIKVILPYLLDRADRIGMAHSVEVRVPYCDHRVAEYMYSLSPRLKFRSAEEKHLLRSAFRGRVEDAVLKRKKSVFPYPFERQALDDLFARAGAVVLGAEETSPMARIFDRGNVREVLEYARQGFVGPFVAHSICSQLITLDQLISDQGLTVPTFETASFSA